MTDWIRAELTAAGLTPPPCEAPDLWGEACGMCNACVEAAGMLGEHERQQRAAVGLDAFATEDELREARKR